MHHQFNIQQLYAVPTLYLCVLYLSENKLRLVPLLHKLIGFYNRDEKCLQRGTDWAFKYSSLHFSCKWLRIQCCAGEIHKTLKSLHSANLGAPYSLICT
jgi:hypothetical protein